MTRKISDLYNALPFELTTGQKNLLSLATSGCNVLALGDAGAGKTTVMEILEQYWGDKVLFCGMTGISNMRLFDGRGGTGTAARVLGLPLGIATRKQWRELTKFCNQVMMQNDKVEYIVIEECGSLNAEQLHLIESRIQKFNREGKNRGKRDIKLILVGDLLQLGTIVSEEEKQYFTEHYGSHFFFKSDAFKRMEFKTVYLNEVKRQKDKTFMQALDVFRYGNTDRMFKLINWLNKQCYSTKVPTDVPRICSFKSSVASFNTAALNRNKNELFVFTPDIEGTFDYNEDTCPIDEELEVKVGMIAMTLTNDLEGRYQNGSHGIVTDLSAEGITIKFHHSGEEVLVEPFEFKQEENVPVGLPKKVMKTGKTKVGKGKLGFMIDVQNGSNSTAQVGLGGCNLDGEMGTITEVTSKGIMVDFSGTGEGTFVDCYEVNYQEEKEEYEYEKEVVGRCLHVPICHAAAISIHKSQGATIPSTFVIDVGYDKPFVEHEDFGKALSYVAFSRSTSLDNIVLKTKLKREHVKVCKETIFWLIDNEAIDTSKLCGNMWKEYETFKDTGTISKYGR
ncbi:P-loop containing nucleoside triphosphate hydrolase [Vibrio phage 1.121.O._10N.286.46.C4]|nr:P-loop containing nucleoside triphosphate hydrolase [Vibrio phage 1.121.O._10N.286.46.C4]